MIIVIKLTGKGNERADSLKVYTFEYRYKAEQFVAKNTDLDNKYWSFAKIVENGDEIELFKESFI